MNSPNPSNLSDLSIAGLPDGAQPKPLPLFMRASELLTREIAAGHWQKGERLPTESELSQQLGMAVGTVRKALAEMAASGLVERRQGSGTYVRGPARQRSIYEFFRLELNAGGGLPTARLLEFQRVAHPPQVPVFGPGPAAHCYRVRRLRLLGGLPVALEEIWFDARHRKGLQAADLSEALYLFYRQSLGFWISRVEDHVSVAVAPAWAPPEFGCPVQEVCGQIERKAWSGANKLEEFSRTWFDPKLARYTARWQ
jgi:DNA-binding GntR family transcriptional regulator